MGIAYCIVTFILFIIAGFITHIGLGGFSALADELLSSLNIITTFDVVNNDSNLALSILFISMVQSTYISKMVGKMVGDDSEADKLLIYIGNVFLGCFLGLMYQSFPFDLLSTIMRYLSYVIAVPTGIVLLIAIISAIREYGILPLTISVCVLYGIVVYLAFHPSLIGNIIVIGIGVVMLIAMVVTNPLLLGISAAILPPILVLLIFTIIESFLPLPGIVLIILIYLFTFPLTEFFSNLADEVMSEVFQTISPIIDVVFFIFSIVMIGLWIKVVVISPTSSQIKIDRVNITVPEGRVVHKGYVGQDGVWQLYTNGYLEVQEDDLSDCDELALPWDKYKDDIRYVKLDDSVEEIQNRWFLNYKNLEAVYLPSSLQYISSKAFMGCDKLKSFDISEENTFFSCENGYLLSKDMTELVLCPNSRIEECVPKTEYGKEWYVPLLSDRKIIYQCTQWSETHPLLYYSGAFHYYALYDINQDGIDELFLTTSQEPCVDGTIILLSVDDTGNVHCLESVETIGGYYSKGENYLVSYIRSAGEEHYIIEEYADNSMKLLYDLYIKDSDGGSSGCFSGDKEITKEEYDNLYKTYVEKSQQLEYAPL